MLASAPRVGFQNVSLLCTSQLFVPFVSSFVDFGFNGFCTAQPPAGASEPECGKVGHVRAICQIRHVAEGSLWSPCPPSNVACWCAFLSIS